MGGMGSRFHSTKPKQFIPMAGKALCLYGAEKLERSPSVDAIVYVIPAGYERNFALLLAEAGHQKPSISIVGGKTRQESGALAIRYLRQQGVAKDALVLLQDGDRPRLQERYLQENFLNAEKYGSSVTAIPCTDSVAISKIDGVIDGYIPRSEVWLLQTPQAFRFEFIDEAFQMSENDGHPYTDDASLVLAKKGIQPHLVLGDKNNIKITTPEDQRLFEKGENQ